MLSLPGILDDGGVLCAPSATWLRLVPLFQGAPPCTSWLRSTYRRSNRIARTLAVCICLKQPVVKEGDDLSFLMKVLWYIALVHREPVWQFLSESKGYNLRRG